MQSLVMKDMVDADGDHFIIKSKGVRFVLLFANRVAPELNKHCTMNTEFQNIPSEENSANGKGNDQYVQSFWL